jgi:hypothetical protein
MPLPSNQNYVQFLSQSNLEAQQKLVKGYYQQLIRMYGLSVQYFRRSYEFFDPAGLLNADGNVDWTYGYDSEYTYGNEAEMIGYIEMGNDAFIFSMIGADAEQDGKIYFTKEQFELDMLDAVGVVTSGSFSAEFETDFTELDGSYDHTEDYDPFNITFADDVTIPSGIFSNNEGQGAYFDPDGYSKTEGKMSFEFKFDPDFLEPSSYSKHLATIGATIMNGLNFNFIGVHFRYPVDASTSSFTFRVSRGSDVSTYNQVILPYDLSNYNGEWISVEAIWSQTAGELSLTVGAESNTLTIVVDDWPDEFLDTCTLLSGNIYSDALETYFPTAGSIRNFKLYDAPAGSLVADFPLYNIEDPIINQAGANNATIDGGFWEVNHPISLTVSEINTPINEDIAGQKAYVNNWLVQGGFEGNITGTLDEDGTGTLTFNASGDLTYNEPASATATNGWGIAPQVGDFIRITFGDGTTEDYIFTQVTDRDLQNDGISPFMGKFVWKCQFTRRDYSHEVVPSGTLEDETFENDYINQVIEITDDVSDDHYDYDVEEEADDDVYGGF